MTTSNVQEFREEPLSYGAIERRIAHEYESRGLKFGDIKGLVDSAGIKVITAAFDTDNEDLSGFIEKTDTGTKIYINGAHSKLRRRFTLCHELGHFFLNHIDHKALFVTGDDDLNKRYVINRGPRTTPTTQCLSEDDIMEIEANRFAACMLMPKELVERYWSMHPAIDVLADIFMVSCDAMTNRLKFLKLIS